MGLIKVIYQVTTGKSGCVFSTVHLILSISNVSPELRLPPPIEPEQTLFVRASCFVNHLPPVKGILKDTLLGLGRWEEDDERNTGHIGKEKYKFSWLEREGSFISRTLQCLLFKVHRGLGDELASPGRGGRPHCPTGHTQISISTASHQISPPQTFSCQNALG